jgi:hypothetical protein
LELGLRVLVSSFVGGVGFCEGRILLRADLSKSSIVIQNYFDYESMSLLFNKADKKKEKKKKGSFPKALQCSRNQAEQLCTAADTQEKWVRLGNIGE